MDHGRVERRVGDISFAAAKERAIDILNQRWFKVFPDQWAKGIVEGFGDEEALDIIVKTQVPGDFCSQFRDI
jgi:hypothetical protein